MVEDVTTSGKSIDETYPKLMNAANVEVKGLIVSLNRMEVGKGGVTTAQKEIEAKYGFPVASIVSMAEVTEHLYNREVAGRVVRMEVGKGGVTTAQKEIEAKYGFPVASIVSMAEVTEHLYNREVAGRVVIDDELKAAIDAYYEHYGARE